MEKDKSPGHGPGGGMPPPSSSWYASFASSSNGGGGGTFPVVKSEPSPSSSVASAESAHFGQLDSGRYSHDISGMPDFPSRNPGHRRAHSEILCLPDDISFDSELGVVGGADGPSLSDENEEDLLSLYLDMEKFSSSSPTYGSMVSQAGECSGTEATAYASAPPPAETLVSALNVRPRVRHQHSQSMDGSTSIKPELLTTGPEGPSLVAAKKAMSQTKLADLAILDPKRAKRIWANRQSAARSKERKMRYILELERKVQTLQTEATTLSAQLNMLQRDTNGLTAENNELKLRLQTMEQQVHLQDALNDALREEVQHLKMLTGQAIPNGGQMMNFVSSSFGANQQFYSHNHAMQPLLAAHQLQQLQIHPQYQQQFHPHQRQHQQQQAPADLKFRGSMTSLDQNQQESTSNSNNAPMD